MSTQTENSTYAWIITVDHLADDPDEGEAGTTGPSNAPLSETALPFPNRCIDELREHYSRSNQFKMYDDDGILYYTGICFFDDEPDEDACYGPLGDFGMPNAGAVLIKYTNHPEWDCG